MDKSACPLWVGVRKRRSVTKVTFPCRSRNTCIIVVIWSRTIWSMFRPVPKTTEAAL
ncbi:MAG TPA: hypothetical protein VMV49_14980 [Candidatus Deferrimicrobium sp.]|nr:hypothetical protein [Candidatus Deferrimicrobium sp.]